MSKIIAFEGLDGVGKTTQLNATYDFLQELKIDCIATQELAGNDIRSKIRELFMSNLDPYEELMAVSIARRWHFRNIVKPALDAGKWVLMDRYIESGWAYQYGGRKISKEIIEFFEKNMWDVRPADLNIYLTGKSRRATKNDRFEEEDNNFFDAVEQTYRSRVNSNYCIIQTKNSTADTQKMIQEEIIFRFLTDIKTVK
jgi:dTMP kinase